MRSKEYSQAALAEGFCHFYAADVFNDHGQTNCSFEYYKHTAGDDHPVFDCEWASSGTTFEVNYIANCTDTSNAGRGTEGDWFRQLWDVHTNTSSSPSFTQIVNWLVSADDWGLETAYQEVDEEANEVGAVPTQLRNTWNAMKDDNGVDH